MKYRQKYSNTAILSLLFLLFVLFWVLFVRWSYHMLGSTPGIQSDVPPNTHQIPFDPLTLASITSSEICQMIINHPRAASLGDARR